MNRRNESDACKKRIARVSLGCSLLIEIRGAGAEWDRGTLCIFLGSWERVTCADEPISLVGSSCIDASRSIFDSYLCAAPLTDVQRDGKNTRFFYPSVIFIFGQNNRLISTFNLKLILYLAIVCNRLTSTWSRLHTYRLSSVFRQPAPHRYVMRLHRLKLFAAFVGKNMLDQEKRRFIFILF